MPRIALRKHARLLIGSSLAMVLLAGGVAFAVGTIPGADGVIHGCFNNMKGDLRVIDPTTDTCSNRETGIFWSQTGPQGPQGEQGLQGATGETGQQGPAGPSLVGSPCASDDGSYNGTIDMEVDPTTGDITLGCVNGSSDPGGGGGGDPTDCDDGSPYTDDLDHGDGSCSHFFNALADSDGDGYRVVEADGDDCDDSDAAINPGAIEVIDGVDNDCDSVIDDDAWIERCNGVDDDGDGLIDEDYPELGSPGPNGGTMICSADGTGTVEGPS